MTDYQRHLDAYNAEIYKWKKHMRKTGHALLKVPADIQVPVEDIQFITEETDKLIGGVKHITADLRSADLTRLSDINQRLRGLSKQAENFVDLVQKISPSDIAQDASSLQKEGLSVSDIGDSIKNALTSTFDKITGVFEALFSKVQAAFKELSDALKEIGEKVVKFVGKVTDEIKEGFEEFWALMKPILQAIWSFITFCWDLAKSLAEFTVWLSTVFLQNLWKTILISPLLFVVIYYLSKTIIIYLTGTPDEIFGALLLAGTIFLYAVSYNVDLLLNYQDMLTELMIYVFLNPLGRWILQISTKDPIYTDFDAYVTSAVVSEQKALLYKILDQIKEIFQQSTSTVLFYLIGLAVILKFLFIDIPLQSFRLVMKDITGFGTIIQV